MKLFEYIENEKFINRENCIELKKYTNLLRNIISNDSNNRFFYFDYSEDFLEYNNIIDLFGKFKNMIILTGNVDIDFPPPKKPYKYDNFFDKNIMPHNYEDIDYYKKIDNQIVELMKNNNIHIFSYSLSINNSNLNFVPLGISNKFNHFHLKKNRKEILCYLNIGIPCDRWFGNPRKKIIELLKNKSFIKKNTGLSIDHFYEEISKSKFAVCPRGCGIDTYRLWDCIILGCIPITEKYNSHEQFNDLPILFLDNIEDYKNLDEDFLNKKYEEFLNIDFNYDKCKFDYWENKIKNYVI
jgi:hypothetical protein